MTSPAQVLLALGTVRDPELDEPVTTLGFVASCAVSADGVAEVHLRLPTYFCAPNFAFLMVADAFDAVSSLDGVRKAVVVLEDHFAADVINAGVAARAGFVGSFVGSAAGEAVAELDDLRVVFLRKAVLAGTDLVSRPLQAAGMAPETLLATTLGQLAPSVELSRLRARRAELGLGAGDDDLLVVDVETGLGVGADDLRLHLGRARLTRVGIEANSGICRGMLHQRYAGAPAPVGTHQPDHVMDHEMETAR